jgi:hypothetical protein
MPDDSLSTSTTIHAPVDVIFAVLANPTKHAAIDGTGWVSDAIDSTPLTAAGQIFRMAMYHPGHPDGNYQTVNQVQVFDPPQVISWKPGYYTDDGTLDFGGWLWRYDLTPSGPSETTVTLTYDWSAVPADVRRRIGFPPFAADHLANSLAHLAELASS